jgi:hypothetical protein
MKKLLTLSLLSLSIYSVSDGHSEGAFNTLFVKAADVDRYVTYMKNNPAVFEQTGVDVAGVCVTTSGQSYPGQMFVWNAFPSTEVAMNASSLYDPFKANSSFQRLREPKFTATFVPLKAFELDPGFERVWKVRLNDWKSYVAAMTKLEKAQQEAGHDVQIGVFAPIGGGTEAFHMRTIHESGADAGRIIDEYLAGASWGSLWDEAQQYVDEIVEETVEQCQIIYSSE